VLTKGTATAAAPTAPAQLEAISHVLLLASIWSLSTWVSLMGILNEKHRY
jgi:hypothetical protein